MCFLKLQMLHSPFLSFTRFPPRDSHERIKAQKRNGDSFVTVFDDEQTVDAWLRGKLMLRKDP